MAPHLWYTVGLVALTREQSTCVSAVVAKEDAFQFRNLPLSEVVAIILSWGYRMEVQLILGNKIIQIYHTSAIMSLLFPL